MCASDVNLQVTTVTPFHSALAVATSVARLSTNGSGTTVMTCTTGMAYPCRVKKAQPPPKRSAAWRLRRRSGTLLSCHIGSYDTG
eukprot:m.466953 g.466953  ORF g.466953 m.466953 type:complete len:85 (+) comp25769_c0_seq1:1270-1524(+)